MADSDFVTAHFFPNWKAPFEHKDARFDDVEPATGFLSHAEALLDLYRATCPSWRVQQARWQIVEKIDRAVQKTYDKTAPRRFQLTLVGDIAEGVDISTASILEVCIREVDREGPIHGSRPAGLGHPTEHSHSAVVSPYNFNSLIHVLSHDAGLNLVKVSLKTDPPFVQFRDPANENLNVKIMVNSLHPCYCTLLLNSYISLPEGPMIQTLLSFLLQWGIRRDLLTNEASNPPSTPVSVGHSTRFSSLTLKHLLLIFLQQHQVQYIPNVFDSNFRRRWGSTDFILQNTNPLGRTETFEFGLTSPMPNRLVVPEVNEMKEDEEDQKPVDINTTRANDRAKRTADGLLFGFFEFWSQFDWKKHYVSVRGGVVLKMDDKQLADRNGAVMVVEDPFTKNNQTEHVPPQIVDRFVSECLRAKRAMKERIVALESILDGSYKML